MTNQTSSACRITAWAALAAGLFLSGCATKMETTLIDQYRTIERTLYANPKPEKQPVSFDNQSTFEDYLLYSFSNNPGLRASFDRWKATLERIPQARSLDDPELSFEYLLKQYDTRYQLGLTQRFPAFGKLKLRALRASSEAEAAMNQFETDRFMLYDQTSSAFYEYHYLAQSTGITQDALRLVTDLERVVTTRYQNGQTAYSDLINIQIEKDRLNNQLDSLQDERRVRSSSLAALLNVNTDQLLPWPAVEPSGSSFLEEAVFVDILEELNPELKAAEAEISAKQYGEKLARRNVLPDFMIGVDWMTMANNKSDIGLMAGITLPLWPGKTRAAVREAEAETRAALNSKKDLSNRLQAELSQAVFDARDAGRRIDLFKQSLIPKAEQALRVIQQDFASGKTGFMQLIDAQRTLLEFQLMEQRAIVDREIALTEIGCCIGKFDLHVDE